nr:hypothetical protein [uncultured Pseudogulbenkiania sp.]
MNRLKNRWTEPDTYESMAIDSIAKLPQGQRATYEAKGGVAEGYIVAGRASGPESVNCEGKVGYDKHVWLSTSPRPLGNSSQAASMRPFKAKSIVVEPTPHWQEQRPILSRDIIYERLSSQQTKVRVYGPM